MDINNNHQGIGILGGSFNPVHIGHLRVGIEVFERFYPRLKYIDLVPCAHPPHKDINGLLPFDLRVELLKSAITNIACLKINTNEALRSGPSYTYDTLLEYNTKFSCQDIFFILGEKDFLSIQSWHRGLYILELSNIIVIKQNNHNNIDFKASVLNFWPKIKCDVKNNMPIFSLAKTSIFYLDLPYLDISASMIRERWMQGKDIKYLSPDSVIALLNSNKKTAKQYWADI